MFKDLNPILHAQLRLSVMSHLVSYQEADFNALKEATGATSGNLSVQIKKLEKAEYVKITKGFKNNYQHTLVAITAKGLDAFEEYVNALKQYINKE